MKISAIQYLRAIAAIAVVFEHAAIMTSFEKYFDEKVIFYDFFTQGHYGVKLFFIISGFIIVVSAFEAKTLKPKKTFSSFIMARFLRIVPLMWIAIISYAILRNLGTGDFNLIPYLNAFFLFPIGDVNPNNIWTLRHEFIFYIIFGISFLLFKRMWFIFLLWISFPLILWFISFPFNSSILTLSNSQQLIGNIFSHVNLLFGSGVLVGVLYLINFEKFTNINLIKPTFLNSCWFLVFTFLTSLIFLMLLKDIYSITEFDATLISIPIFTILVLFSSYTSTHINKLFFYLGNASYAIYLFHLHFVSALLLVLKKLTPNMPVFLVVILISLLSIIIECIIYSYLEKPLLKYLHKRFK